jgi:hypothetical protein
VPSFVPLPQCGSLTLKIQCIVQSNHFWHQLSYSMCEYRWGFGLVSRFTDRLQVTTTNNYNIITISTLYSSLEHKV